MSISSRAHWIAVEPNVELFTLEKWIAPKVFRVILLLPCAGSDHQCYDCPISDYSLMNFLARLGYRVFGVEFRGFGLSKAQ